MVDDDEIATSAGCGTTHAHFLDQLHHELLTEPLEAPGGNSK